MFACSIEWGEGGTSNRHQRRTKDNNCLRMQFDWSPAKKRLSFLFPNEISEIATWRWTSAHRWFLSRCECSERKSFFSSFSSTNRSEDAEHRSLMEFCSLRPPHLECAIQGRFLHLRKERRWRTPDTLEQREIFFFFPALIEMSDERFLCVVSLLSISARETDTTVD